MLDECTHNLHIPIKRFPFFLQNVPVKEKHTPLCLLYSQYYTTSDTEPAILWLHLSVLQFNSILTFST